jgi:hypothetical protein
MTDHESTHLVETMFRVLLGRQPSDDERHYFVPTVDSASGALAMMETIVACPEYIEKRLGHASRGDNNLIELLFEGFLARRPSREESEHFTNLQKNGAQAVDLALRLRESEEFRTRRATSLYVPPGHFYSPVVNTDEVKANIPQVRPPIERDLPDVPIDLQAMESLWRTLVPTLRNTPFTVQKSPERRYYYDNSAFAFADSMMLRAMILHFRPRRIIEVGSGFSSACTLDSAFDEAKLNCEITFIEPYPDLLRGLMSPDDAARVTIIPTGIQSTPVELFKGLQANDILFIDSTHVVKTGSDVVYELSTVLPALAPGVIVHFHDIFYPFEYGYEWVVTENRSWNEIYALRAFLAFNTRFEIIFFNDMFGQLRTELIDQTVPDFLRNTGGSIWLRVRDAAM